MFLGRLSWLIDWLIDWLTDWLSDWLYPFWNHWRSLQSDWFSAVWFIHESHHLFALNRVVHVLNCVFFVFYRTIFAFILHHFSFGYKKRCKSLLVPLSTNRLINIGTDWILRFQNSCNKVVTELRVVQFWSEITIVTSNRTRAARLSDFKITRMISDQITRLEVQ